MALPSEFRLKGRREFEAIRRSRTRLSNGGVILKVKAGETGRRRFAVAALKKVGAAHRRNRIKRVISEWIRHNMGHFPEGKDYYFLVTRPPEEGRVSLNSYEGILKELTGQLEVAVEEI